MCAHCSTRAISSARTVESVHTLARARVLAKQSAWSVRLWGGAPRIGSRHHILYYIMYGSCILDDAFVLVAQLVKGAALHCDGRRIEFKRLHFQQNESLAYVECDSSAYDESEQYKSSAYVTHEN